MLRKVKLYGELAKFVGHKEFEVKVDTVGKAVSFLIHNFIPVNMLRGILVPLIKDKFGDASDSNNYRPVMLSSVLLKLFEHCLLEKIDPFISLNDRQHGFRKRYSTACICLKETVNNYLKSNSDVYACFIDISKAFDTINHNSLFENELLSK